MARKVSFKKGTTARTARRKVAEDLKAQGVNPDIVYAEASNIVKRVKSPSARKRLARKGLRKAKGS